MSEVTVLPPEAPQPKQNGHISMLAPAPGERGVKTTAIIVRELGVVRPEYTTAVEGILLQSRQAAGFFNEPEVTEARLLLAVLRDPEGFKEAGNRRIAVPETFAACLATVKFREPADKSGSGLPTYSEQVQQLLGAARSRAGKREPDIDLVAVEDLVHVMLEHAKPAGTPVVLQPKPRGNWGRAFTGVAAAVVVVAGVAAAVAVVGDGAGWPLPTTWDWRFLVRWLA